MSVVWIGGVLPTAMEEDARRDYCFARRESTLTHVLCGDNFLTRPPNGRYFSPALPSDCFAIDFPGCAINPSEGSSNSLYLIPLFRGVAKAALYCAHRTSTVSPCAFCEQAGRLAAPSPSFRDRALHEHRRSSSLPSHSSKLALTFSSRGGLDLSPIARIEGAHSDRAASDIQMILPSLLLLLQGVAWLILECARRTRSFRGRAFREQEDDQDTPSLCFHHFQSRIEFMSAGRATDAIRFDRKFV